MTVQDKVYKVVFAEGKVLGKVTAKGVETVLPDFIKNYQEAVEVDTSKEYADKLDSQLQTGKKTC